MKLLAILTILLSSLAGITYVFIRKLAQKTAQLKNLKRQLLDQTELVRFASEAVDAGLWQLDLATGDRHFSTQWFRMLGYENSDRKFSLPEFKEFVHPEDIDTVIQAVQRYIASGDRGGFDVEFRLLRADGVWCWVRSKGRVCAWDEKGMPLRIIGLDLNIQIVRHAQEKVDQSEAKLRAIFDCAPYAVTINRLEDGQYLDANSVFLENMGLTKEEVLSRNAIEFSVLPKGQVTNIYDTLLEMGIIKNFEVIMDRKEGQHAHILCSSVLLDVEGQKQVVSMSVDVTGKTHAEEAVAESEERFRLLFQSAPVPLVEVSHDGRFLAFNTCLQDTLGYTTDDIPTLEHWWEKAYPDPEYREYALSTWVDAVAQTEKGIADIHTGEFHITCKDGSKRTMIISANMAGSTILVSFVDITERKQEEKARMENLELLRATLNATPDGILVVNKALNVTQVNRQFFEIWDIPEDLRKTVDEQTLREYMLSHLADPAGVQKIINKLYRDRTQDVYEIAFKNGRVIECYTAPMEMDEKEIGRVWGFRDISEQEWAETERQKLQQQLLQAQKLEAMGILAGGVAHDVNNMLGAIIGYGELTMSDMGGGDPFRDNLAKILDAAKRSAALNRQLLSFARKQDVTPVVFDMNASIASQLKMLRRLIGENIALVWRPAESTCNIKMDPAQLEQILANLCVNAKNSVTEIGTIMIKTEAVFLDTMSCKAYADGSPGDYIKLTVKDNGYGMDHSAVQHVFEPFFTTKEFGKETGLGLSTVYSNVKRNAGFIDLYSEPGIGTTFKIFIPRYPEGIMEEAAETIDDIPYSKGETILIVEDDLILLKMGEVMLQRLGYNVFSATTPTEAVRVAVENNDAIQLFLTDVLMPEMNGCELAERLIEIQPRMKHLFMSGYTADIITHQGILKEGVNFIQKPFLIKDIAMKIREVLDC